MIMALEKQKMQNDLIYDVDFTDVNNYVVSDLRNEN